MEIDILQVFILAFVQGVTEFLPISSSGHLILFPMVFGWPDQGQGFDVALHVGSLIAVMFYFRRDVSDLFGAVPKLVKGQHTLHTVLLVNLVIATLPALLAGVSFKGWIELNLRGALVIAATTIGFGILLWHSDRRVVKPQSLDEMPWWAALIIGVSQVLALIPGTSRSGITMTAGRYLGYGREESSRFSFLMSIPIILAAGVIKTVDLLTQDNFSTEVQWDFFLLGTVLSAISAYFCILLFLKTIQRIGMLPFVLYRLVLGAVLIYLFW